MTSMQKLVGPTGATFEVVDTAGVASIKLDGVTTVGAQGAAVASLTDNSGGTADNTLVAISGTYVQAEVRNNFADLAAKVNAILAAMRAAGMIAT